MLSPVEKIVFVLLIVASLTGFWLRFAPVVRIIRAAKPDSGFQFGAVLPRIRRFVWEVLLQGKVIQDRPVAGAAHALVFWGFCAFALITVNHVAIGFGLPLLMRSGAFGAFYSGLAAIFAVAVAVSISYLAFRRYVLRPVWLGKLAPESGVIAALMGQRLSAFDAAQLGTYMHGLAGDIARDQSGTIGMIAGDIVDSLPDAFDHGAMEPEGEF